jgi:hypothetical protein
LSEFAIVLIGVFLGWLGSFLHQTYYAMTSEDVALINDYIVDVMDLEDVAVHYWLAHDGDTKLDDLADMLRGRYYATGCFETDAARLLKNDYPRFKELDGFLFDAAMGGDFQTKSRSRNPATAVDVMRYSRELRALLRRARRKRYWAR